MEIYHWHVNANCSRGVIFHFKSIKKLTFKSLTFNFKVFRTQNNLLKIRIILANKVAAALCLCGIKGKGRKKWCAHNALIKRMLLLRAMKCVVRNHWQLYLLEQCNELHQHFISNEKNFFFYFMSSFRHAPFFLPC